MKIISDLTVTGRPIRPRSGLPQPSLRFDFVTGAFMPGGFGTTIAFSRASTAAFHDAAGVMQLAAADAPRLDHDRGTGLRRGLLIEDARTNLFLQSAAPVTRSIPVTARMYALSFWGAGSIVLSGAHSATLTGAGGNARGVLVFTPSAGTLTLTVSGSVQMAQLEVGNCATSYIATTTTPVTRAKDEVILALGSWWNASEGTFLAEWQDINQQNGNTRIIGLPSSRAVLTLSGTTGIAGNAATRLEMWSGAATATAVKGVDISKGITRGVGAYSASGRSVAVRNVLATVSTPLVNSGSVTEMYLGQQAGGSLSINGCLRRLVYYPRRLTDPQILELVQ
jgi:hypothetical protein